MRALLGALLAAALSACSAEERPDAASEAASAKARAAMRVYVLDCGAIASADMGAFDRGGAYDGRAMTLVDPCYLVRHPKGDFLWDAGLGDAIADSPDGVVDGPFTAKVQKTLASQLEEIGVAPADIEYFSLSHSHFDHTGNANLFAGSTFIVQKAERAHMFGDEARADARSFATYSALENAPTKEIEGDHDVFGDGSVTIVSTPGHTPGHSSLLIKLENFGPLLLSGDLYHFAEARQRRTIPTFNTDPEETLRSMDKFEKLAGDAGAWVAIQHEPTDYAKLKHSPDYLD